MVFRERVVPQDGCGDLPSCVVMTAGQDPWELTFSVTGPPDGPRRLPGGPNLPYIVLIVLALVTLIPFLMIAEPFSVAEDTSAATTTTASVETTITTIAEDTSTTIASTTLTTAADPDLTTPTLGPDAGPLQALDLQLLASGIPFPVFAASIPDDDRIFVLERQGRIRIIDPISGLVEAAYLNLTDRVGSGGIENGLLGMAFHPDFADNGRLFVYYTSLDLNSRISEFEVDNSSAATVDAGTERILLEVPQRGIRHRAGMLEFGPDGYLYAALGDGGMADDSAQDLSVYQGKILRIDIDNGDPYAIPADNPYASGGGLGEIWAYGLRNPWRFSIDVGVIYIGDVGQANWEEINVQPLAAGGLDYGWPNFEGEDCYKPSDGCDMIGWQAPTLAYTHEEGCSVSGGYVYRGVSIPELYGHYFYADWCNGWIRSFRYHEGEVIEEQDWSGDLDGAGQVSSFGLDSDGELLVVDSNGSVYRVVAVR